MYDFFGRHLRVLGAAVILAGLAACSGTAADSGTTPPPAITVSAAKLIVTSSVPAVKSDNSDAATVTVTALDANNVVVKDVPVVFKSNSGALIVVSSTTDANGKATATYSAGDDKNNRVEVLTVSSASVVATKQISVLGSTLVLAPLSNTNINANDTLTFKYTVADASGSPIPNTKISLSSSGAGAVSLSSGELVTDSVGVASVVVTAKSAGEVSIRADSVGTTVSQKITVASSGNAFSASPSKSSALVNESISVTASVQGTTVVVFASTFGGWNGGSSSVIEVPVVSGVASANFSSAVAGLVSFSVFDKADPSRKTTFNVAYSPDLSSVSKVVLQASPSVVAPSIGGVQNTSSITATVTDANGARIANAPVSFKIVNPSSGGESFSNIVAFTGNGLNGTVLGVATTSFISGALPSGQSSSAIQIQGTVNAVASPPLNITVAGGVAGSVTLGQSSKVESVRSDTTYKLPMSVQVADAAGNPVANATVALSVWPYAWSTGTGCFATATYLNEDQNENLVKDAGEDGVRWSIDGLTLSEAGKVLVTTDPTDTVRNPPATFDGFLTPQNSNAGSIPKTVTTDVNGVATFDFEYLKSNSIWTVVRMSASTVVQGTETKSQVIFRLGVSEEDVKLPNTCRISDSPYRF